MAGVENSFFPVIEFFTEGFIDGNMILRLEDMARNAKPGIFKTCVEEIFSPQLSAH